MKDCDTSIMAGTTTVGIIFDGGIVLATEKRATMGSLIASKRAKKIYQINNWMGMTTAGGVGDAQQLTRIMTVEANLFAIRRGRPMSVSSGATLLSNILHGSRLAPYYVQLLVGGCDETGPSVYSVDAIGGASPEEDIVATGSGSPMAYGVLEDRFYEGIKRDEAIQLAIRALNAAMRRDAGSGEGIALVTITKEEYREFSPEEISAVVLN